jgi:CDP-4-dehydro-6-deoxyglucose reductase
MPYVRLTTGKSFESSNDVSLLDAATKSGVLLPYSCKTGRCSTCKCKVISGETTALAAEVGLSYNEMADGWILSCVRAATSDVVLKVEDLGGTPLPRAVTLACRISVLERLASDVIKVVLRLPPSATFYFIPGQYINVIGPGGLRRSYSLANAPRTNNMLELHIRSVKNGAMSHYWFSQAAVNDLLRLHGPLGTFFMRDISERDLLFLATGTGIAPIKAMLESLPGLSLNQLPKSVCVLWGGRNEPDLYFNLAELPGSFKYIPVLSRSVTWSGECGYIQDALLRHTSDFNNCSVYACGSETMIRSAKAALIAAGLPSMQFRSDAFLSSDPNTPQ